MGVMEERFLDRLQQSRTRCAIGAVTFVATLVGGICYFPFTSALILSVEPTPTSPSGVAHRIYAQYFPPEPVQLLVLVKSRDGSPLIPHVNSTLEPEQPRALERWVAAPPPTPLTAEAAQVSHELSGVAARELDVHCRYTFLSYFDIGLKKSHEGRHDRPIHDVLDGIISRVARPMLFDSDASRTLMLVQIEACHGEDMTAEIVGKNEASAPVVSAMEALKDYADAYPASSGLAVERVSFPGVMATVQEGVETAMLLSTLTAIPAFVLLGVFFKNLRLLIITLINIAFCVATSVLIMYPVSLSMKAAAEPGREVALRRAAHTASLARTGVGRGARDDGGDRAGDVDRLLALHPHPLRRGEARRCLRQAGAARHAADVGAHSLHLGLDALPLLPRHAPHPRLDHLDDGPRRRLHRPVRHRRRPHNHARPPPLLPRLLHGRPPPRPLRRRHRPLRRRAEAARRP